MAYQSLYRRYRPQRFSEVRGQGHVIAALRNAVRDGRTSHAYLFSGPRGTGKTSTARILAKALNCEHLQDGEPCCECESCLGIERGTSYDLQELDAASNNGVDAMRDLIARAALGSPGRTKVYILDEVHMLSTAASNALLKTLEEPPPHVVFVLATTDPEKVLRTIRSRTQHYEFHLLPAAELADHVRWVARDAGLDVDDAAIDHVLRTGGGSARDTLSALDQVVAAGRVPEGSGDAGELVDAICASDTGRALRAVDHAVKSGREPRVIGEGLLALLRDIFLARMGVELDHLPEADQAKVAAWAERFTDRSATQALEGIGGALLEMRQAPDPRIPLEVALVRATRTDIDTSIDALAARIDRLEQRLAAEGSGGAASPPADAGSGPARAGAPPAPPAPPGPSAPPRRRPGDAARAALGASAAPAPAASEPTRPAAPEPTRPAPPQPARPAAPGPVPARSVPPDPEPAAAAAAEPVPELPDRDALTLAWGDAVLPNLRGLTKALYAVGRFLDTRKGSAVFALPNETHKAKCSEKLPDVEAALAAYFGFPVPLQLVVDPGVDAAGRPGAAGDPGSAPHLQAHAATGGREAEEDHHDVDVSQLADAPADDRSPIDRIVELFPGAEVVEGE